MPNANISRFVDLGILDEQFDRDFDDLTLTACELLGTPVSLLSIIDDDHDRQFFKSYHGLGEPWASSRSTPLSHSFCLIVRDTNRPLIINDAREHALVSNNPAIEALSVVAYMGVPVHDPKGNPLGALCVIQDKPRDWEKVDIVRLTRIGAMVSDLIRMRTSVRESERAWREAMLARSDAERLMRIIEHSSNEVFVFDGDSLLFIQVNRGASNNLQYSHAELLALTPLDLKPQMTAQRFAALIEPLRSGRSESLVFESVHRRKDGTVYPCEIRLECDRSAAGLVFVAFCQDLSEHKTTIARLRQERQVAEAANRAQSAFIANISHEIRTPMNGVLGMAEVLAMTPLQPEQRQMLSTITAAGGQLLTLINDILDLSKIESGMFSLHLAPFVPGRVIADACALFESSAQIRGLAFSVQMSAALQRTWIGSETRIGQIVGNLVGNAVKFTREGGITVIADLAPAGDPDPGRAGAPISAQPRTPTPQDAPPQNPDAVMLRVRVRDTGAGVPDALKPKVFERFQQGHPVEDELVGGAGLGLTIARALCQQHGGTLEVQDTPGGGATFVATLLLRPAAHVTLPPAESSAALHDLRDLPRPLTLLVAEDNATNRTILAAMLRAAPITLTLVDNGIKALEALKTGTYDGALLDIQMPGLPGDDVARALRHHEQATGQRPVPLVSWTASVSADQMRTYTLAGFDLSLPKPTTGADLARTIRWISERPGS